MATEPDRRDASTGIPEAALGGAGRCSGNARYGGPLTGKRHGPKMRMAPIFEDGGQSTIAKSARDRPTELAGKSHDQADHQAKWL